MQGSKVLDASQRARRASAVVRFTAQIVDDHHQLFCGEFRDQVAAFAKAGHDDLDLSRGAALRRAHRHGFHARQNAGGLQVQLRVALRLGHWQHIPRLQTPTVRRHRQDAGRLRQMQGQHHGRYRAGGDLDVMFPRNSGVSVKGIDKITEKSG